MKMIRTKNGVEKFTDEQYENYIEENKSLEEKNLEIINLNKVYLNSTDWYVIRKIETGVEIPVLITENRVNAREEINKKQNI